jgi:hypothetical protein
MKNLRLIFAMLLFLPLVSCSAQTSNKDVVATNSNSDKIEAYYFHFSARCVTCNTIEAKAKENLEVLYPEHVKSGLLSFQSVNLDDAGNKPLAKKLGIAGQTLILVKGQ